MAYNPVAVHCANYVRCMLGAAIAVACANCRVARGQSPPACNEGKPYSAQRVQQTFSDMPDGSQRSFDSGGLQARDTSGREYSETISSVSITPPKNQIESAAKNVHSSKSISRISIYDCHTGEEFSIRPDLKTVVVSDIRLSLRHGLFGSFEFLTRGGPLPPGVTVEDLGFKEIEGLLAHGYRETMAGAEDDEEWRGKTHRIIELWISDDLGEIVLGTMTTLKSKWIETVKLTKIKREEPPTSLFEIPGDYKVERLKGKTTSALPAEKPKPEN